MKGITRRCTKSKQKRKMRTKIMEQRKQQMATICNLGILRLLLISLSTMKKLNSHGVGVDVKDS